MDEISKDDNKKIMEHYFYKPVSNTISEVKMYFILLISVQVIITILILLMLIMFFIHVKNNK